MTSLPRALAAWKEPLSLFPPELALSLGSCVRRLAQALGPLASPADEISDDPNGYDGLTRRGSYERLLISEWLLADEAPEEFLRRAAQREHAFLALSFRRPGGSRRSLALFDAGPDLIGEPRIGQLAALVVLSQRAIRGGATFAWGVLQDDHRYVSREVTPTSILGLLYARTTRTASPDDAKAWAELDGGPLQADDLWVIGSRRTIPVGGPTASRLELEDPLLPGKRHLVATVRRQSAAPRAMELPLPERPDCVRLLRDPFSVRQVAKPAPAPGLVARVPQSPANGIAFSQNGSRLLVRHRDGSVSVYPVPSSPALPTGAPSLFELHEREKPVAACWTRRSRVVLVQGEPGLFLHTMQRHSDPPLYQVDSKTPLTPSVAPAPLSPLLYVPGSAVGEPTPGHVHVFVDAENQLFTLGGEPDRTIRRLMSDVLAYAEHAGDLHVIRGQQTGDGYRALLNVNGQDVHMVPAEPGLRAFLGCSSGWSAIERAVGRWEVFSAVGPNMRRYSLEAPSGTEVFGVVDAGGTPALLLIESNRRATTLVGLKEPLTLTEERLPIVAAVASSTGAEIATLEVDGTVIVMSLTHHCVLLEIRPGFLWPVPKRAATPAHGVMLNLATGARRERR